MSAKDDYPILACVAVDAQLFCWTEAVQALNEIDRLRSELAQARSSEQHPTRRLPPLTPEILAEMERHQRSGGREMQ